MDNCSFSNKFTIELFENSQFAPFKTPLRVPEKTDIISVAAINKYLFIRLIIRL